MTSWSMTVNIPLICRDFKMSVWNDPPKFHISQLYKSLLLQIILLETYRSPYSVDKMKRVPTNGPLPLFSVRTMAPDNLINNLNGVLKLPIGKYSSLHFFGINSCLMKLTRHPHLKRPLWFITINTFTWKFNFVWIN